MLYSQGFWNFCNAFIGFDEFRNPWFTINITIEFNRVVEIDLDFSIPLNQNHVRLKPKKTSVAFIVSAASF